jgi:protein SCO1
MVMTEQNDNQARSRGPRPAMQVVAWALLIAVMAAVGGAAILQKMRARGGPGLLDYGTVPAFSLTDQTGATVSNETLAGAPYIIDFIFTRCAGQCPIMTARMKGVEKWLAEDGHDAVRLVSVTVDPDYDTTTVMAAFAKKFEADSSRWSFLAGSRAAIYSLARDGFKLGVDDQPASGTASAEEPIIHSNRFVLVDAKGQIRGYYTGLDPEDLDRLREELPALTGKRRTR